MFLHQDDKKALLEIINQEMDLAFIIPNQILQSKIEKYYKWKAVQTLNNLEHLMISLWHVPSGPISYGLKNGDTEFVKNPFDGWETPERNIHSPFPLFKTTPSLSEVHTGIFDLRFAATKGDTVGRAAIDWMASNQSNYDQKPLESTINLWNRLEKNIEDKCKLKVPRTEDDVDSLINCFPAAKTFIDNGGIRKTNSIPFTWI